MEDQILIKSEIDKKVKNILRGIMYFFLALAIGLLFYMLIVKPPYTYYGYWDSYVKYYDNGFDAAFRGGKDTYIILFIVMCSSFLLSLVSAIIYWAHSKCEIVVTEKNVKGKALFGKEVVLPMYMISAYSTRKFLSVIAVATASGITKFSCIQNYAEIGKVLSQKINERQDGTMKETQASAPKNDSVDDIIKLKALLDQGIITQEEFDAKKKQILGL